MIATQDATGQDVHNGVKEAGEIDIFEGQGGQPRTFYGTMHDWIDDQQHTSDYPNWFVLPAGFDFRQFHTYGLLWIPGTVTWYLDDKPLFSAPTPSVVDSEDFFLILGSQEGARWQPGSLSGVTAQKITIDVDWVRVLEQR